jgi:hypothetical protein
VLRSERSSPILPAALICVVAGTAVAGVGSGDSAPAIIDTRPPVVSVDDPPANLVLQTGETISLGYAWDDDHPGGDPGDNRYEVWLGDRLWETGPDQPGSGTFTWNWTVPDTSSASVHLVVTATDAFGNVSTARSAEFTILSGATDVPDRRRGPVFSPPAPNPFNPRTVLRFDLPASGPVRVTIHDAQGRRVRTLLAAGRPAGPLSLTWDGRDDAGQRLASGTFFARLETAGGVWSRKMTLLK